MAPSLDTRRSIVRRARIGRGAARGIGAATMTVALVGILALSPDASNVYAATMFASLREPGQPAMIAGHRGDRAHAPENTIPALRAALDSTMDFVETDVQLSADGIPVIIHDPTVDRTTNGTGEVAALTLAQLKELDAGSWYAPGFAGATIPTLDEFLEIFSTSRKKAIVELKGSWPAADVEKVRQLVYARGVQNRVIFASFDEPTVETLRAAIPLIPRVIICRDLPEDPVALVRSLGAIAIVTNFAIADAHPGLVMTMHQAGLGVLLYTLNSTAKWSEALALGVDGIITDKPSTLDSWLASSAPGT